jgi:RNA-directed DNA polymerase
MIPKASGVGQRPLGIPTIRDRVVQAAAVLVLDPIFEADFDEAAYGYRPKRSALEAVRQVSRAIDEGHTEVVDADLSQYFDTIPHSALMTSVARRISDGQMLRLIKLWLKAPVVETDEQGNRRVSGGKKATRGTPQGGVASPLLANIYMHRFIKAFRQHGLDRQYGAVLITYADDFVILCRHGAAEVLETTRRWMTRIGLTLNEDKTRLLDARCDAFDFLGYTCGPMYSPRTGGHYHGVRPSKKAVATMRDAIRRQLRPGNPGTVGGHRPHVGPHCAELVPLFLLRHGHESAARCGVTHVPHRPSLSAPPAQDCRVWLPAVSHATGTGCPVTADAPAPAAAHAVA